MFSVSLVVIVRNLVSSMSSKNAALLLLSVVTMEIPCFVFACVEKQTQ